MSDRTCPPEWEFGTCRYGRSRLAVRGPLRRLHRPYIAFLGGSEVFGRFVSHPVPDLVEQALGIDCINLAAPNAGIDSFVEDVSLLSVAAGAELAVVQVMGAHTLSNRFYRVHRRRNDRVTAISEQMRQAFPGVEAIDHHFPRHLLRDAAGAAPQTFPVLVEEMRAAWTSRMATLIERLDVPVLLLWMADHDPGTGQEDPDACDPLFVDRAMLDSLAPSVVGVVEVVPGAAARADRSGMVFPTDQALAAARLPSPAMHADAAAALVPVLRGVLAGRAAAP